MKKFRFINLLILLLASCSQEDIQESWDIAISRTSTNGENVLVVGKKNGNEQLRGILTPAPTDNATAQWQGSTPSWPGNDNLEMFVISPVPHDGKLPQRINTNDSRTWMIDYLTSVYKPSKFSMKHLMAKLKVHIKISDAPSHQKPQNVLMALHTDASIDYSNKCLKDLSGKTEGSPNINLGDFTNDNSDETNNWISSELLIIPQQLKKGEVCLSFSTNDGNTYTFTPSQDLKLEAGKVNHLYLGAAYTHQVLLLQGNDVGITDWNNEEIAGNMEEKTETLLLPKGSTFRDVIGNVLSNNTNLKKVKFITNSETTSEVKLVTDIDGTSGYIVENGEWLEIHTSAKEFIANEDCSSMFESKFVNITNIEFGNSFSTKNVTNMHRMFCFCLSLNNLDLSHFDTSNVTNMSYMFARTGVSYLDLMNFDTSNVTDMSSMFTGMDNISTLNLCYFDTSNVKDMRNMFASCFNLESINLSGFNTKKVTHMNGMFSGCQNLTMLDLNNFDTSAVTNMFGMFSFCSNLTKLDLSHFDVSAVTNMSQMFNNCHNLTILNLCNFNASNVKNMSEMFAECYNLNSINLMNFNTSSVTNMHRMFYGCKSLTSLDLSDLNTSSVTNMSLMFEECHKLTTLNISNFKTGNVTDMSRMFNNCYEVESLDVSNFNTENVTNMSGMFTGCTKVTSLDFLNFSFSKNPIVESMLNATGLSYNSLSVKVTEEGYTYLTKTTNNCNIYNYEFGKFVKADGTEW